MTAPRLEIRLDRIRHNAETLVDRLTARGIAVTGVTKATLGSPQVATELIRAGVTTLGDSHVENIETMRRSGITAPMMLIRSPMPSQVSRVVASVDISCTTELTVIRQLSAAARSQRRDHGVLLMVELGDLREGILPNDLDAVVRQVLDLPNISLRGIGTNLACQSGVIPDNRNMAELSDLVTTLEQRFGLEFPLVSGGNSANVAWALGDDARLGRINDLRLGESILLGREPLHRQPIDGLDVSAFTLVGEVIESKAKPSVAWGDLGQAAFGMPQASAALGTALRVIVALGRQDTDPDGLTPPEGFIVLGASSDHLMLEAVDGTARVGQELRFGVDYSAMLRSMTSPFVDRVMLGTARAIAS